MFFEDTNPFLPEEEPHEKQRLWRKELLKRNFTTDREYQSQKYPGTILPNTPTAIRTPAGRDGAGPLVVFAPDKAVVWGRELSSIVARQKSFYPFLHAHQVHPSKYWHAVRGAPRHCQKPVTHKEENHRVMCCWWMEASQAQFTKHAEADLPANLCANPFGCCLQAVWTLPSATMGSNYLCRAFSKVLRNLCERGLRLHWLICSNFCQCS